MKKLFSLLSLSLFLSLGTSFAQYSYQDINSQLVNKSIGAIGSDNSGNVIVSGNFATTITFGTTTLVNVNSEGSQAGFVSKLAPNGTFSWAKCFNLPNTGGISSSQVSISKLSTDAAGNIYVTGAYLGNIKMDNISLSSKNNTWDIFTVKMSSAGGFLWAKSEGTGSDASCTGEGGDGVTTDVQGNVYTTGKIVEKVYKNTNYANCACGLGKPIYDIYVVKYNSSGTKLWEKKYVNSLANANPTCDGVPMGNDIQSDGSNVYVTGSMYGSITFGNTTFNTGSNTVANAFLLKLDGNGNTLWAKSVTSGDNKGLDVVLDNNNADVYLNGSCAIGTITFGGPSLTTSMANTQYIGKYSSSGNCSWAVIAGRVAGALRHHSFKHPNGNLAAIVGGYTYPYPPFVLKEFSTIDGAIVDSTMASVFTSSTDVIKLPGGFVFSQNLKGSYDFGGITITSTQPTTSDYSDMILVKYGSAPPPMIHPSGVTPIFVSSGITLYPNPAANQITIANSADLMLGSISIYNISGQLIYQKRFTDSVATIDVSDFAPGLFFVKSDEIHEPLKFVRQ